LDAEQGGGRDPDPLADAEEGAKGIIYYQKNAERVQAPEAASLADFRTLTRCSS
jgi:hypothetical protein